MKINRISFLVILIISLCTATFAQNEDVNCPKIIITSENTPIIASVPEKITAKFSEKSLKPNINYFWTVSKGIIEDGQGTSQIQYIALDDSNSVAITLKISGLPKTCSDTVSATFAIKAPPPIEDPDTFGKIPLSEYKARLDNVFILVRQEFPDSEVVLILRFDVKDRRSYRISRLKNISKLITALKFDKTHFSFIIFEGDEEESRFWIIQPGMDYPTIENSTLIKAEELNQKLNKLFPIK